MSVKWLDEPEKHDYPAAAGYLALVATPEQVDSVIQALKDAPITTACARATSWTRT